MSWKQHCSDCFYFISLKKKMKRGEWIFRKIPTLRIRFDLILATSSTIGGILEHFNGRIHVVSMLFSSRATFHLWQRASTSSRPGPSSTTTTPAERFTHVKWPEQVAQSLKRSEKSLSFFGDKKRRIWNIPVDRDRVFETFRYQIVSRISFIISIF